VSLATPEIEQIEENAGHFAGSSGEHFYFYQSNVMKNTHAELRSLPIRSNDPRGQHGTQAR
jgi:hypothetical protein